MAKKVILKDQKNVEILPITRAELVIDSDGNIALHSEQFLATDSQPGLTSLHFVEVSPEKVPQTSKEVPIVQLKKYSEPVHPITVADAVIVNTDNGTTSLTNVLREIQLEVSDSKTILDDRPTEGNTTHSVSSDGIFKELKETVGNIQILLQNV